MALNETLEANEDPRDGKALTHRMWNRTFEGNFGTLSHRNIKVVYKSAGFFLAFTYDPVYFIDPERWIKPGSDPAMRIIG